MSHHSSYPSQEILRLAGMADEPDDALMMEDGYQYGSEIRKIARMMTGEKKPLVQRWQNEVEEYNVGLTDEPDLRINRYAGGQGKLLGSGKRALDNDNKKKRDGKMAVAVLDHKMGFKKVVVNKAYLTSEWDAIHGENRMVMGAPV